MPLRERRKIKFPLWQMPVSYRLLDQGKMSDSRNCCTIQKMLQTRAGTSRFNSTSIDDNADILSISYFKDNSDTRHIIAKAGRAFFDVATSGSSTAIKQAFVLDESSLDEDLLSDSSDLLGLLTKHRGVSWNGRHFIATESDGLFQYDGTTFTQLGQDNPSAPTVAKNEGGGTLSNSEYQVALTFYDSGNGFETNIGAASSSVNTDGGNDAISVSAIPSEADNANIDKVRIYLKDVTAGGEWIFVDEISLGTTTYEIDTDPTSTQNPPTKNAPPLAGGAKYLAMFGDKLVYAGNSNFPSDVFFSERYIPDAFDDTSSRTVLTGAGNGPITGLATGFYNNDNLSPYLCIFKRDSVEVYSELGGTSVQSLVSPNVGGISHDTIQVINGDVYFMSTKGWHVISNGRLVKKDRKAFHLADGDIDNIFNDSGFVYELNKGQLSSFFSVYYPVLDQYITFIKEAGSTESKKAYVYENQIEGFRPYQFPQSIIDACVGEDANGETVVFMAVAGGFILKHSISESRTDVLEDNSTQAIETFGNWFWVAGDDMDASYNFGPFTARAQRNDNTIQFNYFLDYKYDTPTNQDFDFSEVGSGFVLDVSKLDEGILSDGRDVKRFSGEINKTAQSLLIGFYHNVANSNINFIEAQLGVSKNGSPT